MLSDSSLRQRRARFGPRAVLIAWAVLLGISLPSAAQTTVSGPGPQVVRDLTPLTLYQVTQDGNPIYTRVSSSQGVISFDTGDGDYVVSRATAEDNVRIENRFAAMLTPAPGETFVAPAELRLVAEAFDLNGRGPGTPGTGYCLDRIEFYVDDTRVAAMGCVDAEHSAFKTRVTGIAPGTHAVWARGYAGAAYYDSRPHTITVLPAPAYARVVTLNADLNINGQDYVLAGTPDAPIKVVGNGHSIVGTPRSFSATYVDFSDLGDRVSTASNGIEITTNGDVTIDHCRFYSNDIIALTTNGGGNVSITNNVFSSNSRQPLGQNPDSNGGIQHGSWPALFLGGSSGSEKALQGNNFGAGWVDIRSANWTIGGPTDEEGNVAMGARVGFFVSQSFTGTISHNYSHDIYYGGWSQASNFEMGNITGLTIEHNVIEGSSWPVRGLASEFRYNLVTGDGAEGFIWTQTAGPANIHHNVFRGASVSRGAVFQTYGANGTVIRNNTFDLVNRAGDPITLSTGSSTFNSNLVLHPVIPSVQTGTARVVADFNAWSDATGARYSDNRSPAHDIVGDPGIGGAPSVTPFSWEAVWKRSKTVSQILEDFRMYYTPTTLVIDMGDNATFGAGNDIGAVGSGVPNANDGFGKHVVSVERRRSSAPRSSGR